MESLNQIEKMEDYYKKVRVDHQNLTRILKLWISFENQNFLIFV